MRPQQILMPTQAAHAAPRNMTPVPMSSN